MTDDPTRLRDEGSAFLKKALASARADVPDPERAAALEARILPLLLPPPTPPTPPTPPGAAGAAGAAGAGASTGGLVAAKGLLSLKAAALGLASLALVGGAAIAVTRPPSAPPTAETRPVATVVAETARPEAPPAPSALAPLDVIEAITAPSAPAPVLSAPRAPAPSALLAPRASADVDDLAAEAALLRAAQDGLRGDPTVALARASEHARRFPRGALTQEREAIAIEALVKLGRGAEARARADRFARSFPGSTHQRRLDALVGNER